MKLVGYMLLVASYYNSNIGFTCACKTSQEYQRENLLNADEVLGVLGFVLQSSIEHV